MTKKKRLTNTEIYERVAQRILDELNKGKDPVWCKPWSTGIWHPPSNLISKKPYRGFNVFITFNTMIGCGFESPFFLSFKQARDLGGSVRKGEKSTPVMYWKMLRVEDKESGEKKEIPMARYSSVFNVEQCEGIDLKKIPEIPKPETYEHDPIESAAGILDDWSDCPPIKHGGDRACYSPSEDRIMMPQRRRFKTAENYYHTLFHEAVHSTGHKSRLNRSEIYEGSFGNEPYSVEELTAEAGACLLSARAGVEFDVECSAAYINGWRSKLSKDPGVVVKAFSRAQRAVDMIMGEVSEAIEIDSDDQPAVETVAA